MKKWKRMVLALGTAVFLSLGMAGTALAAEKESTLEVNGMGVIMVQPDTAKITVYVEKTGKTAEEAQKENAKAVDGVITTLEKAGIPKDKIVTIYASVSPNYRYDESKDKQIVDGYRSYTNLQATTEDIDHAGSYVDKALEAGATGYGGVVFTLENPSQYYGQALQVAVKNAADSAQSLATAYGKPLGAVQSVKENSTVAYYEENAVADSAGGGMAKTARSANSNTEIRYDKIPVSARITVTYGLSFSG